MAKRKKAWITENFVLDTCTMSLCSYIPMTSVSWIMCSQSLESIWSSRFAQAQLFCLVLSGSNTRENMKLYGAGTANVHRALLVLFEKEVGFDLISCCIHVHKNTKYIVWGLTQNFQEYILSVFVSDKNMFLCASTQRQFTIPLSMSVPGVGCWAGACEPSCWRAHEAMVSGYAGIHGLSLQSQKHVK